MVKRSIRPAYGEGRQALIDAAIRLVARKGLSGLSYRALATEAAITSGALQHHFSSIDEVLDAALDYCLQKSKPYFDSIQDLDDFINVAKTVIQHDHESIVFQVEVFTAARFKDNLFSIVSKHQEAYKQITRDLLSNINIYHDDDLINFISGTIDGFIFQSVMFGSERFAVTNNQLNILKKVIYNYESLK